MESILPKEALQNPNALAEIFEELKKESHVPMTKDQTDYMIPLIMANEQVIEGMFKDFSKASWEFKAFFTRMDILPLKYEKKLKLWLALMYNESRVGGMIFIGYYVQWFIAIEAQKNIMLKNEIDTGILSLQTVIEHIFPMGVFTDEVLHKYWAKQKVTAKPDNLVDYYSSQRSFLYLLNPTE